MSANELLLHEISENGSTLKIVARGQLSKAADTSFVVSSLDIRISFDSGSEVADTRFVIDQQTAITLDIPYKLLRDEDGLYHIRSAADLGDLASEEWAALKQRVRQRLASPIEIAKNNGFFTAKSVGNAKLEGRIWLNPALIDGYDNLAFDSWVLRADGIADIDFDYRIDASSVRFVGHFVAAFSVNKSSLDDWVTADFGFDLPKLPGFDLRLPRIRLPKLEFPELTEFGDLSPSLFSLSLPPFIDNIKFNWSTKPKLKVKLDNGKLIVSTDTEGEGAFSFNGTEWVKLHKVALAHSDVKFEFDAMMDLGGPAFDLDDKSIVSESLPFVVFLKGNKIVPTIKNLDLGGGIVLKNADFDFKFESSRIVICEHRDGVDSSLPVDERDFKALLALSLAVVVSHKAGKTSAQVTSLKILEPYPIELVMRGAEAVGDLIRLVAAIPLPSAAVPNVDASGVLRLLERLGEMLATAARWLARQAGAAAGVLAGLAEAVFDTLMQLVKALGELGETVISHLAVEVRLDPKSYKLRQILVMPAGEDTNLDKAVTLSALGFDFSLNAKLRPGLMIDLGPENWFGLVVQPAAGTQAVLGTDLWLDKETGPQQAMGSTEKDGLSSGGRLIQLTAAPVTPAGGKAMHDIVVVAIQHGRPRLFQTFSQSSTGEEFKDRLDFGNGRGAVAIREVGILRDAGVSYEGKSFPENTDPVLDLSLKAGDLKDRLLSLLCKTADSDSAASGDSFFDKLKQKIEIVKTEWSFNGETRTIQADLGVKVHIDEDFAPTTTISIAASARDLSMKITGGDKIDIYSKKEAPVVNYHPLGLNLTIVPKKTGSNEVYKQFFIDLAHGSESLGLGEDAKALLAYGKVSTSGKGLQFEVPVFRVGRAGFDLEASILPEPVTLGGVDVPFRFTSGQVAIKGSKFGGGSLAGSGQLPQQLVGEANASIALQLGAGQGGGVVVKGATARLDKSGDPIRCSSTRFELTITELGFDFVESGSYHFYFLLTGSAVFKPGGSEFASGLLKNFKDITIKLDKAPLAADPRALINSISFQVKVDPPKRMSFFDIFDFELRGFGFHPAAAKFGGDPAMSISGQVNFTKGADKISPNFEFHSMWIAAPRPGSVKPRIRFDGLTLGIKTGSVDVDGTAVAVDGAMPDLYRPDVLPKDVTAEGFLASGRLDIEGWASMSAAMGFMELRKKNVPSKPKHSFFLYGQQEKLAEPIDTPVGRIYLREFGFGFGYRYTLAGIAQAETAKSPQELVRILDDVSKYQGNLNTFKAWEPTYDNDDLTLALRGMFALSAASERSSEYNAKQEAELPNPLLFDIVAAFRTDLTFLINLRAWVSVNYHDWISAGTNESWKSSPTMRGYLYFSVPRKEFLGRFIADGTGHVGTHPKLPEPVMKAIRSSQFSATLFIRPGLFHAELGWPYELGFAFGKPGDNFYMDVKGGLINRIEDFSVLNGIAFKANGAVHLEGRVGSSSLGAAAVAHANFAIEARVLSYLSLKDLGDSFYYGYMRIDAAVGVRVEVWLSFKIFGKRITLSASFSLHLALSIALEAVIGPTLIGGRAHVSIGVRAFGRSLSVSIGFSFNNDNLAIARAKVARFMELGLAAPVPDKAQDGQRIERNPSPEPPRSETAKHGDQVVEEVVGSEPMPVTPEDEEKENFPGRAIGPTDFWAFLFPTRTPKGQTSGNDWYVMQLVPRDHTPLDLADHEDESDLVRKATFYASPKDEGLNPDFTEPGHKLQFKAGINKTGAYMASIGFGAESEIDVASGPKNPFGMNLDAVVAVNGEEVLKLGKLLQALYLGIPDKLPNKFGGLLEEPDARMIDPALTVIAGGAKASADQLARAGRSRANLSGKDKREAEIEETRSAVLSAVVETAGSLAQAGAIEGKWPSRQSEIDARDFGLTFLVNEVAVKALFDGEPRVEPPIAKFTVVKSDVDPTLGGVIGGHVHLFNHPDRMFRNAQPKFTPTHVIDTQGIKLNWDLEPAWGSSVGVYDDPEFHLKQYRIRRTIRGIPDKEYRSDFIVKAAAPVCRTMVKIDGKEEYRPIFSFLRPDFQFIDDLRRQDSAGGTTSEDIPANLRKLLVNEVTPSEWDRDPPVPQDKIADINVLYEIIPVDNAGTSDFGQSYVIDGFSLVEVLPVSPREATLQVVYDGMPTHVPYSADSTSAADTALPKVSAPRLNILIKPPLDPALIEKDKDETNAVRWPDRSVYLLRIWPQPIAPSGSYGADAVDEARRRPDQDAINRLREDSQDFVLSAVLLSDRKDWGKATLVAEYQAAGSERPEIRYYNYSIHAVPEAGKPLGPELDPAKLSNEIDALNEPGTNRKGYRVFLAAIDGLRAGDKWTIVNSDRRGEWKTVGFNIAIDKRIPDPENRPEEKQKKKVVTAMSSVVEVIEQPVHYEFKLLERTDMRVESGRVIVMQPTADGDLASLASGGITGLRDVARRTATRLEWNANPTSLALTTGPEADNNAIGGFDLYCLDPDALPGRFSDPKERILEIVTNTRPLGRVSLLAPELTGLDPAGFGDFGRIESAYPSATLRQKHAGSGARKAGWYSAAETTAIFPEPAIRRSIMADPDEGLIAALFSGGRPKAIRVTIPGWSESLPLAGWRITDVGAKGWGEFKASLAVEDESGAWSVVFRMKEDFTVAVLRQLLQNLRLVPVVGQDVKAKGSEAAALQRRLNEVSYLSSVEVLIEALRERSPGAPVVVATQKHVFDLIPALHPVLGDALAFLQYDAQDGTLDMAEGRIYRRYALAPDSNPEVASRNFASYLDEAPPERDPYGWGALRTLGLASGFRLFDTETGDYVRFNQSSKDLGERIGLAFARALSRYPDRDNGQPFVDILTQPWGNVQLAWFDGGYQDPQGQEGAETIKDEMLAVVQIALRPHPDRIAATAADPTDLPVRYYALVAADETPISEEPWSVSAASFDKALYDVLTVGRTVASQKPLRLTLELPRIEIHENRPAVKLNPNAKERVLAIVREVRLTKEVSDDPDSKHRPALIVNAPVGYAWRSIHQPAVLDALSGAPDRIGSELAFGRFENLQGMDWGQALFRPASNGRDTKPCLAMNRLGYYAGRRFGPLAIPVTVTDMPEQAELEQYAKQRGELAYRIVQFWTRFVEHCAAAWGRRADGAPLANAGSGVFFSLGTVADPGQWRRAPGHSGTVSVTIVDAERRGARRKYAIRPYGRYEAWSTAAPDKLGLATTKTQRSVRAVPIGLDGVFSEVEIDEIARKYFIDATLPRTEPLEKPVILSSVTHEGEGGRPGRMELVVAHGSDMVLAQANRRNAALLAPVDISVGYWREFAHWPWADALNSRHALELDPMQAFGSLDQRLDQTQLRITREAATARLTNLRQRVPDAWLGSTMISATNLPYFFRVHALVHATAGVVVSDQVATTFEEGFHSLEWPDELWQAPTGEPAWPGRALSPKHRYSVERRPKAQDHEVTVITFWIAALRFIDCMYPDDAKLWFGANAELWKDELKRTTHLPEPGVSYRIAIETPFTVVEKGAAEVLARVPEIEVLPKIPGSDEADPLYLLQQSGKRLSPKIDVDVAGNPLDMKVFGTNPEPDEKHRLTWRIPVAVQLAQEPLPLLRLIPKDEYKPIVEAILVGQPSDDSTLPMAIAGLHELRIEWSGDLQLDLLNTAINALRSVFAPEAVAALEPLVTASPSSGSLPLLIPTLDAENRKIVGDALEALTGIAPIFGPVKFVVLRRPPNDRELELFKHGPPPSDDLSQWINVLAEEQLFGVGRRPAVFAFKGTRPPITATFGPRGEV